MIDRAPFNSRLHTPLFLLSAAMIGGSLTPRMSEATKVSKVWWKNAAVRVGAVLIVSGIVLNEWLIASLFGSDGTIHSIPLRLGIWVVDVLLVGSGILAISSHSTYRYTLTGLSTLVLLLSAFPWITLNQLRPLISTVYAPSIFDRIRIEQMFANNIGLIVPYTSLISVLNERTSCHEIGLKIKVGAFEYPLWQIARQKGVALVFRHVLVNNESVKAEIGVLRELPCAVVIIGDDQQKDVYLPELANMDAIWSQSMIRVFVRTSSG